jgi:hypothetical protein
MRLRLEHGRRDELKTLHPAYFALVVYRCHIPARHPRAPDIPVLAQCTVSRRIGGGDWRAHPVLPAGIRRRYPKPQLKRGLLHHRGGQCATMPECTGRCGFIQIRLASQ